MTAETLEPSQVNFVRAADFTRFLKTNAEASLRAAEQLARNYSAALEQVRPLGLSHSAAARLARFLLDFNTLLLTTVYCLLPSPACDLTKTISSVDSSLNSI